LEWEQSRRKAQHNHTLAATTRRARVAHYYVNKRAQDNGDHEVHTATCAWLPTQENRVYLGEHSSCSPAVAVAKRYYEKSNGCYWCCPRCHTS
jgi:hypothetical protein